jgi:PhnB protein
MTGDGWWYPSLPMCRRPDAFATGPRGRRAGHDPLRTSRTHVKILYEGSSKTLNMSKYQPNGWHTVTPRIVVCDPQPLIEFLSAVFDATGEFRTGAPAEIRIGDSVIMISDGGGLRAAAMPAFLYVYVANADTTYERAIAAGAMSLEPPAEMPYGDRRAMVRDQWGNTWQIATNKQPG